MERFFLVLLFLSAVTAVAGQGVKVEGSTTPEGYWHQVLPSTPIPSSLSSLLLTDNKNFIPPFWPWWGGFTVIVPTPVITIGSGTPVVTIGTDTSPFNYGYAATATQIEANANTTLFFLEKDLVPGSKMTVLFQEAKANTKLLPRPIANSAPFSSDKLPEILSLLAVAPGSDKAKVLAKTLERCEAKPVAGESSFCATSLESMVDFSTSSLRSRHLTAVSTTVIDSKPEKQVYTVEPRGVKKVARGRALACHPEDYAYAVFYCHSSRATRAYLVSLVGSAGTKVEAVVACHTDTSSWNPKHIAFQLLKVKPGTVPVCHFLPSDHVLFARRH